MKVGILLASDFVEGNGVNARIKAFAKGLKDKGESVNLLFLHASSFNNTRINIKNEGAWEGIHYKFLNGNCERPNNTLKKLWDSLQAFLGSLNFLIKNGKNFDLFYIYSPKPHQFFHIYCLAKLLKKPVVVEMTELYSAMFGEQPRGLTNKILKKLHLLQENYLSKLCDQLIVISQKLYHHFKPQFPEDKISLIPIVVDFSRFQHLNGHPKKPERVGYLGSFGGKDDVPGIINAFARVKQKRPNLKLRLMGYPQNVKNINDKLQEAGLNGSVEFFGQVRYGNIPDYLHECDLLVVNRTSEAYSHFGFPTKLGEYLATGKPAVATSVGDIQEYLNPDKDFIITEPENPAKLAEIINHRYEYYHYYDQIGKQGKETSVAQFDYLKHVEKLQNVLYKAFSNSS